MKTLILIISGLLFIGIIGLYHLNPFSPEWIDKWYSNGMNKPIRELLSGLTGSLPFSLAEVLVITATTGLCLYGLIEMSHLLIRKPVPWKKTLRHLSQLGFLLLGLYAFFLFAWGFNYYRPSIIEPDPTVQTTRHLERLCILLAEKANAYALVLATEEVQPLDMKGNWKSLNDEILECYDSTSIQYPSLSGHYTAAKPIAFSEAFSYTGIVGIYFPFTGEANVNTNESPQLLPSTIAHEMAHQRGYAREEDANFIAYLVLSESDDPALAYSAALLALIHSTNQLYTDDADAFARVRQTYGPELVADLKRINDHWAPYRGKLEEQTTKLNDNYLKSNHQKEGIKSYSLMTRLLLTYHFKH